MSTSSFLQKAYERPAVILPSSNMPSESQHKLKSFFRHGLMFSSVVKHGGGTGLSRDEPSETIAKKNETPGHLDIPKTALPSALPTHCPRVPSLPRSQDYASMASHRPSKKGKEKAVSDDRRSHLHSLRRQSHGLSINEARVESAEILVPPDTTPLSEVDCLRRDIDTLKKALYEHKKMMRKQSKRNEELKNEVAAGIAALTEKSSELSAKEEELRKVKDSFGKIESSMSSFELTFQCQVCIELLHRPYALSPCGHVFCLLCLQEWFRKAPAANYDDEEDLENPRYILRRPKSCPCCRTRITNRPIPLFVLRSATNALVALRAQLSGVENPAESQTIDNDGDPWKGIFPTSEDDEVSTSDEDEESSSESAGVDSLAESDRVSVHFTQYTDEYAGFAFESASESDNLSDGLYGDDHHGFASEDEDEYVRPRWQPASRYVGFYGGFPDSNGEDHGRMISLLRRGCPLQMILSFRMTYTREEGIVAYVPSLSSSLFLNDGIRDINTMHRVLLGWNIEVDEEMDKYGCNFMQQMLDELDVYPQRWDVRPRFNAEQGQVLYDAKRLVRLSEMEDYDSDLASYLEGAELD